MRYYTLGEYPKKINVIPVKKNYAEPGEAAKMNERNPQPFDDVKAKTITQNKFGYNSYKPDGYLKMQQLNPTCNTDVNNNSLHRSKVEHRKFDKAKGQK